MAKAPGDPIRAAIEGAKHAVADIHDGGGPGGPRSPGAPAELRERFQVDGGGVWRRRSEGTGRLWICGYLQIICETIDDDGRWGVQLEWFDRDGVMQREIFSRDQLCGQGGDLRSALAAGGLTMNGDRLAQAAFLEFLALACSAERARVVGQLGWNTVGGKLVFVLPDQIFGGSR